MPGRKPLQGGLGGGPKRGGLGSSSTMRASGSGSRSSGHRGAMPKSKGKRGEKRNLLQSVTVQRMMILPHDVVPSIPAPLGWLPLPEKDNLNDIQLPVRKSGPKESFKTVDLKVNQLPVGLQLPKKIVRYEVNILKLQKADKNGKLENQKKSGNSAGGNGNVDKKALPKHVSNSILEKLIQILRLYYEKRNNGKPIGISSDRSKTIYCTENLESDSFEKEVTLIPAPGEDGFSEKFLVQVKITDEKFDTKTLQAAVDNMKGQASTKELDAVNRIYSSVVASASPPRFKPLGKSQWIQYDRRYGTKLGGGLMSQPGYDVSVDTNGGRPYLTFLFANQATVMSGNVIDVLSDFFGLSREKCLTKNGWKIASFVAAAEFLSGFKVKYNPAGDSKTTLGGTVTKVLNKSISEETFMIGPIGNQRKTSIHEYYLEKYNRDLNPNGICLVLNNKANCLVPAEICFLKEGQSAQHKLNRYQTTAMQSLARKNPKELQLKIEQAVADLELIGDPILSLFGLTIDKNVGILKMPAARVLAPPNICYSTGKPGEYLTITPDNGVWDNWDGGASCKFLKPAKLDKWCVLVTFKRFGKEEGKKDCLSKLGGQFMEKFLSLAGQLGMNISSDPLYEDLSKNLEPKAYNKVKNTKALQAFFQEKKAEGFSLILVVLPNDGADLYAHVKQTAELVTGTLTQCVTRKLFCQPKESELKNVLLKLNQKLGGINHTVISPPGTLPFRLFNDPVMILGADVTHRPPSTGANKDGKSYAAIVSTFDLSGMQFMTQITAQKGVKTGALEIIMTFDKIIKECLNRFKNETGVLPRKIIYIRDGVGDSQFTQLLNTEMRDIRTACSSIEDGYEPKITYITVQKRHKTRLFYQNNGNIENPPSGTIVDSEIVHPTQMDSYLFSHKGILGTSRPANYRTIWDDSGFSEDELQQMTFYLCHMYSRCNRSVSIPAPTYYAHIAATRAMVLAGGFRGNVDETTDRLQRSDITETSPMHFI